MSQEVVSSKSFHKFLGVGVSIALLVGLFWFVDLGEVLVHMREAELWVCIPALAVLVVHFMIRAYRWKFLLADGEQVPYRALFDSILVGCLANFILPLRAGEIVRPLLLNRKSDVSFAAGFASVVTERFFDLSAVLFFFAIMVQFLPGVPDWVYTGAWSLGVVALLILGFILVGGIAPEVAKKINRKCSAYFPERFGTRLHLFLEDLISNAQVVSRPRNLIAILVLTSLVWLSSFVFFYVSLLLLDLPLHFGIGIAVGVIVALAVAAPSAPGFVGVYQAACLAGFSLFSVDESSAVAYSILTHVIQYALYLGYGTYVLSRSGIKLGHLRKPAVAAS